MSLKRVLLSIVLPIMIGATGGFAYYHFIGCASGTCPLTSNPYISTSYGAIIGLVLGFGSVRKKKDGKN